jgi:oxidoreductase family protein
MTMESLPDKALAAAMVDALQQRARDAGVVLRAPPPEPTGCCGRGCNGCVWEGYYAAVLYWRDEATLLLHSNV